MDTELFRREVKMGRAEQREAKRKIKKEVAEFLKIQHHYFPDLIRDIKNVLDARNQSYITYEIEVVLYVMILKNICSIESMQEMTDVFNQDECVKNIYKILGLEDKKFLPHYVTINECLSKLENEQLELIRKKMIYNLIRKKSFDGGKFRGEKWLVIIDGTHLFSFKNRHCEHCLSKTVNKGTDEEKTIYYHPVLEAKIVLDDGFIVSIATEFIENEGVEVSKQDCERKAFTRLAKSLKKMFPRLPICIMGDSLYACEPVFETCRKNRWEYMIRYKSGSIPSLAEEYHMIRKMGGGDECVVEKERVHKRKPKVKKLHWLKWVNNLEYRDHEITLLELEVEDVSTGKTMQEFQWLTSMKVTEYTAYDFAETGRKRWLIENQGFNIQKNHRYMITHANSLDYNAMKNHYLLTQIADILLQLYENGIRDVKIIHRTLVKISEGILECLKRVKLTEEDIEYKRMQVRKIP